MVINTRKWRRAMAAYRQHQGLAKEPGFTVETAKPLGKPARALLKRIQENMVAAKVLNAKYVDGTLNSHTQDVLIPPVRGGDKAVAYALKELGVHESPWGSNNGADVHRFQSSTGAYGEAWCASFFWYCWQQAGYKGPTSAGAWDTTDNHGQRVAGVGFAHRGDAVSLNEGEGHVGLYLSHDTVNVQLIAGNTNNAVAIKDYPISMIHSICRPIIKV